MSQMHFLDVSDRDASLSDDQIGNQVRDRLSCAGRQNGWFYRKALTR